MKPPANETFLRWLFQGISLIGVGILAGLVLHISFGLPTSKLAVPVSVLLGIRLVFYVGMYPVRQRYRRTRDLRIAFFLTGVYCLCMGLAGMHYAGQLGIARTFEDNYIGFSVYVGVLTFIAVVAFSFAKPKPNS